MESNGMYLARKDISNKLMIFRIDRKKTAEFHRSTKVMSKKNWDYDTAEEGGGSRHFFDR